MAKARTRAHTQSPRKSKKNSKAITTPVANLALVDESANGHVNERIHENDYADIELVAPRLVGQTHADARISEQKPAYESEPEPLQFLAAGKTHAGMLRDYNQDDFVICNTEIGQAKQPIPKVFVVVDGMGGTVGGELASEISRVRVTEWATGLLRPATPAANAQMDLPDLAETETQTESLGEQFADLVRAIGNEIFYIAQVNGTNMGTTLTGVVIVGATAYVVNMGDSRTYFIRNGEMRRVSKDHSLVEQMVDAGKILDDERYSHPQRNIITRALGDGLGMRPDVFECALQTGDTLLICSDGLWEMVRDPHICDIVCAAQHNPALASRKLVQQANANGGDDNVTAIVVSAL